MKLRPQVQVPQRGKHSREPSNTQANNGRHSVGNQGPKKWRDLRWGPQNCPEGIEQKTGDNMLAWFRLSEGHDKISDMITLAAS
jgi:hypothetical protein